MTRCFRISKGPDVGDILDSIEALTAFAREHGPGIYYVDVHSLEPFTGSNVSARPWGKVVHWPKNGEIVFEPIEWPAVASSGAC